MLQTAMLQEVRSGVYVLTMHLAFVLLQLHMLSRKQRLRVASQKLCTVKRTVA